MVGRPVRGEEWYWRSRNSNPNLGHCLLVGYSTSLVMENEWRVRGQCCDRSGRKRGRQENPIWTQMGVGRKLEEAELKPE